MPTPATKYSFPSGLTTKLIELLASMDLIPSSGYGEVTFIFQSGKIHRITKKDDILIK